MSWEFDQRTGEWINTITGERGGLYQAQAQQAAAMQAQSGFLGAYQGGQQYTMTSASSAGMQQLYNLYTLYSPITGEYRTSTFKPEIKKEKFLVKGDLVILDIKQIEKDYSNGRVEQLFLNKLYHHRDIKLYYNGYEQEDLIYNCWVANCNNYSLPIKYLIKIPKDLNESISMLKDFLKKERK